jgi:hypothetical protein
LHDVSSSSSPSPGGGRRRTNSESGQQRAFVAFTTRAAGGHLRKAMMLSGILEEPKTPPPDASFDLSMTPHSQLCFNRKAAICHEHKPSALTAQLEALCIKAPPPRKPAAPREVASSVTEVAVSRRDAALSPVADMEQETHHNPFAAFKTPLSPKTHCMDVVVSVPHSDRSGGLGMLLKIEQNATVGDLLGLALWDLWEEHRLPGLAPSPGTAVSKREDLVKGWSLLVVNDGIIDYDMEGENF